MDYKRHTLQLVKKVQSIASAENKPTGFCIGNTAKIDRSGLYFTPIRNTSRMVVAGVIVYSERQAVEVAKIVNGKVDYALVDTEKKVPDTMSLDGKVANVERAVREVITKSTLWLYKGNDLAVEAIDSLLAYLTKDALRGIGGRRIAILGAGNLGCKLALTLVERGGRVFVARRDVKKLKIITQALNFIKPRYTTARVTAAMSNEEAAQGADILIGTTQGVPVITSKIIRQLASNALIIEAGKGTFYPSALKAVYERGIEIYRLDVSAAFEGLINKLFAMEDIVKYRRGRQFYHNIPLVSGGLMGRRGEIVVDNIHDPKVVYGIADGNGDFIRMPRGKYAQHLRRIKILVED